MSDRPADVVIPIFLGGSVNVVPIFGKAPSPARSRYSPEDAHAMAVLIADRLRQTAAELGVSMAEADAVRLGFAVVDLIVECQEATR